MATRTKNQLTSRLAVFALASVGAGLVYIIALGIIARASGTIRFVESAAVTLLLLAAVFTALERIAPEQSTRSRLLCGEKLIDVCWWFVGYGSRFAADIATTATLVVVIRLLPNHPQALINTQPIWLQVIEALLIGDFFQYWIHRALHRPLLWAIHAVHHTPEEVNWLSTTRIHPLETIFKGPIEMIPLYFLGFSPIATLPLVTIALGLYEIFLHANVGWRFGPLRFVLASPAFHRWHHTAETEGFNKNYAGLFPFYDVAFGTFHLPSRASSRYGLGRDQRLASFWEQLAHPLRPLTAAGHFPMVQGGP